MKQLKLRTHLLCIVCCILIFTSCKEDEIMTYDGETNIYFSLRRWFTSGGQTYRVTNFPVEDALYSDSWYVSGGVTDSLSVSMAMDGTDHGYRVTLIPVSISGNVVDYDRPLAYSIDPVSTAEEGIDFKIGEAMIPANRRIGAIAIMIDRAALKDKVKVVDFILHSNEHFQMNYSLIKRSSTDTTMVNLQKFRIWMSNEEASKPAKWDNNKVYWGEFSVKKFYLLLELTGANMADFYSSSFIPTEKTIAYSKILKAYLADQKANNNTIYESDGVTEMTAGTSV